MEIKTHIKKIALIGNIYFLLMIFPYEIMAITPQINSVSAPISTGQIITISGSNMINEDRTNWDPFFSESTSGFEGTNLTADGYTSSCGGITYDANVKLMGNKSIKSHVAGASNYPNYGTCPYQFQPRANVGDRYFRVYSRWNANVWPNQDIKYWWLGGGETQFLNLMPNGELAPSQIGFYASSVNSGNWLIGNIPSGAIEKDRWYLIEMHVKRQGYSPYRVEVWVDNKLIISTTNVTGGVSYNSWGWEANTNYWNTSSSFALDHWQDGFVISSSRVGPASLIEIGNSSTYDQATVKYQQPVSLGENSHQVKLDLAGLGSGPYYLWITNNKGERSAPYLLGGGSSDTTPPTVSLTSPSAGTTVSGTVTVSANASDNVGVAGVQFKLNGATLGTEDTSSPYSISWNTATVSNGTYTLTAIARDAAGNQTTSPSVSVLVNNAVGDTTPPTVSLTSPSAGTTVSGTVTVSANASDNVGVAGVQFKLNGATLGTEDTSSPYSISWNTATVSNGTYTLTAIARDAAGNQTTSSTVSVSVNNATTDGTTTLFEEKFEDTNLSSRGWYDNTSLALSSTEHISGSTKSVQYRFAQGATKPDSGNAIRKKFNETDSVYLSYWVKYSSNWTGSNKPYHPHEFFLLTNKNGDWDNLAYTFLTAYIEQNEGEPMIALQDGQNIDESQVGIDLTSVTELRSVAGCNGDSDGYGNGTCYSVGPGEHWNGKDWKAGSIYFSDNSGPYYKNDWHFIEAYIKLNSISGGKAVIDGILKYWYDGNLVIDKNNVVLRTGEHPTMKFNQIVIAPYIGDGSPIDQTFWIDNLTVATGRPGGNTPTNLSSPSGLKVQ